MIKINAEICQKRFVELLIWYMNSIPINGAEVEHDKENSRVNEDMVGFPFVDQLDGLYWHCLEQYEAFGSQNNDVSFDETEMDFYEMLRLGYPVRELRPLRLQQALDSSKNRRARAAAQERVPPMTVFYFRQRYDSSYFPDVKDITRISLFQWRWTGLAANEAEYAAMENEFEATVRRWIDNIDRSLQLAQAQQYFFDGSKFRPHEDPLLSLCPVVNNGKNWLA